MRKSNSLSTFEEFTIHKQRLYKRLNFRFMLSTSSDTLCVQFEIISDLKTTSKEFSQYFRDKIINRRYQVFQKHTCTEGQIKTAD